MFDGLAPRMAALGYHVVAVDFRGHGDSGPLDTGFAWTLLHLDLALLVRHLGADRWLRRPLLRRRPGEVWPARSRSWCAGS